MRTLLLTNFRAVPDGTALAPAISFTTDPATGLYKSASGQISIAISGTERLRLSTASGLQVNSLSALSGSTVSLDATLVMPVARVIRFTSGTNAKAGNATLVAGTVTVGCTGITASSIIQLTVKTIGGTPGTLSYTLNAGVGFTINSSNAADTSVVTFTVFEVA